MNSVDVLVMAAVVGASAVAVRVVREVALRTGRLDTPNERSAHVRPTPRLGGIGIMVAFLPVAAWASWKAGNGHALLIVAATAFISVVGLVDDLRPLPARVRFGAQCLAAAAVVFGGLDHLRQAWAIFGALPIWLLAPLSLLWIVWLTNLYNFMDGIDGLAGGQTVIAGIGIAVAAAGAGAQLHGSLALLLAAAALGFLVFNFPPASIFMGDVGSTAIGFLLASLPFLAEKATVPVEAVAVALALFILDATVTLIRRLARGEKFFQAHRTHFYQRPLAFGIPHRRVTLAAWAGMVLTASACAGWPVLPLTGRLGAIAGAIALFLGYAGVVISLERRAAR